jgi:hypothetical protein
VELEVALAGNAQDATVGETVLAAGPDGSFSVELTAGSVDAQFVLRVTAADGAVDEVQVVVEAPPVVDLSVDGMYGGRRRTDFYRVVVLTDLEGGCPGLDGRVLYSASAEALPAAVPELPSGVELGVMLSGAWCPEGETSPDDCQGWVKGCEDGVVLEPGADEAVEVTLADDPGVFAAEAVRMTISLDTQDVASTWAATLLEPLQALVDDGKDPGTYLLDGIYERIGVDIGATQADLFLGARTSSELDAAVNGAVADVSGLVAELVDAEAAELSRVVVSGGLEGAFWELEEQTAALTIERVGGRTGELDAVVLAAEPPAAALQVTYVHDEVTLGEHALAVGAGELSLALLEGVVLADGASLLGYLVESVDCAGVGAVLAGDPEAGSIADATWYEGACETVVAELAGGVVDAASAMDTSWPGTRVQGGCDYLGADGYPQPELACIGGLEPVTWGEETLTGGHDVRLETVVTD